MATATKQKPKEVKNRPVHEVRFGRDDLPLAAKVCDQAHTWNFEQVVERSNGNARNGRKAGRSSPA